MTPPAKPRTGARRRGEGGIGANLRRLRAEAGMSVKEMASGAGLAASTISKIESEQMSPTYDVLLKLAGGLGTDLSTLILPPSPTGGIPQPTGRLDVTRAAERRKLPAGVYTYEPLAISLRDKAMDPTFVEVNARDISEFPELIRHPGEELVFVISGSIELHLEFYAPVRLNAGDSVYFDASMGHAYISIGQENARILNICAAVGSVPLSRILGVDATET